MVFSLADFEKVHEAIEDAALSRILREAKRKEANASTTTLADVKRQLGLVHRRTGKATKGGRRISA